MLIAAAYIFRWPGTGFTPSQKKTTTTEETQSNTKKVTTTIEDQPAKTLWDWLQLAGIPVVLGVGTLIFTTRQTQISEANRKQQHETELQIAKNQQQEELLRTYFDKISDLLLDKELSSNPKIQSIVRARTLAVLPRLNAERKTIVLRFLHDSDLLQYVKSVLYSRDLSYIDLNRIDLSGADLSGADLSRANLSGANLGGADLSGANLHEALLLNTRLRSAKLIDADLSGANLYQANLSGALLLDARLSGANLQGASLQGATLFRADLSGASLRDANLSGAKVSFAIITPEQLEEAINVSPEQLARIKSAKPAAPQEAKITQASTAPTPSEIKPDQTSQEEAEQ